MKILKTVFIIWLALLGVIIVLFLFKDAKKTPLYKKLLKFIEEEDEDKEGKGKDDD
jgi:hypothetical protein